MPSSPLLPTSYAPPPAPPIPSSSTTSALSPVPPPRSAKSLGKQRAVHPPSPSSLSSFLPPAPAPLPPPPPPDRHIMIRFTDGGSSSSDVGDLSLYVSSKETVQAVKRQIRSLRPSLEKRQLRLIHSGRVLSPSVKMVGWLNQAGKRSGVGAGLEGKKKGGEGEGQEEEETVWIHCAVGLEEEGATEGDGEEEEGKEIAQIVPLRGFDTLRSTAGLSEQDVAAMRRQFHGLTEEEELDDSARNLEEQWIDGSGNLPTSVEDLLPTETYSTILHGLLTGFFFPLLPLFFFKESEQHSFISPGPLGGESALGAGGGTGVVFSRRMQVSLMLGFGLNVGFGFLRYLG